MKNKKNKMILFWGLNLFIIGNLFPLNVIMAKTNQQKYIDIENIDIVIMIIIETGRQYIQIFITTFP